MVIEPLDYTSSQMAARGLARRAILDPMFSSHRIDGGGVLAAITEAVGSRAGLRNDISRQRFAKRLRAGLGGRLLDIRTNLHRPVRDSNIQVRAYGVAQSESGPILRGFMGIVRFNGHVTVAEEIAVPRHSLERAVQRGGVRDLDGARNLVSAVFMTVRGLFEAGSEEMAGASGRILLPPISAVGGVLDDEALLPVFCRASGAVVTFLPVKGEHSARGRWARQFVGDFRPSIEWFDARLREGAELARRDDDEAA
jgi:hypothetical protein